MFLFSSVSTDVRCTCADMNVTDSIELRTAKAIHQRLPVVTFITILMVVGTVGNLHVLIIFSKIKDKKSTYPLFVKILAIVDLLTCLVHMPLEITDLLIPYTYGAVNGCKLMQYNQVALLSVSLSVLVLIANERYNRICRPYHSQMTSRRAGCYIVVGVTIAVLIALPMYFVNGHHVVYFPHNITGKMCFYLG